jgi:membrane protease YdiL (CAAX protease family)
MVGMYIVQIVAAVVVGVVMVAGFLLTVGTDPEGTGAVGLTKVLLAFMRDHLIVILGVAQLATVVFALLAIRLRVRPHGLSRLGWQLPWVGHWLLVALLMPPLWLMCSTLQHAMFQVFPSAGSEMADLMNSLSQAPLPILVLVIGFGPAIGEELLFRGLIGRGLVARRGLVQGIIVTSVLFGIMHLNAGQSVGVIPLGLAMHFVYVTTRSFWAPVTLHLINNGFSVVLLKLSDDLPLDQMGGGETTGVPAHLLVASAAMVTAIAILLWQTRIQFILPDGSEWNPGYVSTEVPPAEADARPVRQTARPLLLTASTFNSLGFAAAVWRLATAL